MQLVSEIGAFGVLAVLLIYSMPKMLAAFREDRHADRSAWSQIVQQFQAETREQREHYHRENKYEREQCDKHHTEMSEAIKESHRVLTLAIGQIGSVGMSGIGVRGKGSTETGDLHE